MNYGGGGSVSEQGGGWILSATPLMLDVHGGSESGIEEGGR